MAPVSIHRYQPFPSAALERDLVMDLYLPDTQEPEEWDVLVLPDGQDAVRLGLCQTLQQWHTPAHRPLLVVAMHAGKDRMQEYGIAQQADYQQRGSKASATTACVLTEMLPFIRQRYPVAGTPERTFVAGFSLSGLMAFDLAWHHPEVFGGAGIFSGSFWWRKKALGPAYDDATDRIMHALVRAGKYHPGQKFWFQAGTADETADRNGNGVIDAIDDTLDLMEAMKQRGCPEASLHYHEVQDGTHDPETWGKVFPDMLEWLIPGR